LSRKKKESENVEDDFYWISNKPFDSFQHSTTKYVGIHTNANNSKNVTNGYKNA
jgi:hypothetical protein